MSRAKRIPPMWTWKPALVRKLALPVYLLLWVLWQLLGLLLLVVVAAVMGVYEHLCDLRGWRGGWVWCRATWRGENVGKALADHLNAMESHGKGAT